MCGTKTMKKWNKTNRSIETKNKLVIAGAGSGWMKKVKGIKSYRLPAIKEISQRYSVHIGDIVDNNI